MIAETFDSDFVAFYELAGEIQTIARYAFDDNLEKLPSSDIEHILKFSSGASQRVSPQILELSV